MTPDEMRQLDGLSLARLAFELHLAPEGTELWEGLPYAFGEREPWEPHTDLAQAHAVFRSLRARGWTTQTSYNPHTQVGAVRCTHILTAGHDDEGNLPWITVQFFAPNGPTEAHALTLCAVLAVVSDQSRPPHADGSVCHCLWSTAGWFHHHCQPTPEIADAAGRLSEALGLDDETTP